MYTTVPKEYKCSGCGREYYTTHERCLKCLKEGPQEKILSEDRKRLNRIIELHNEANSLTAGVLLGRGGANERIREILEELFNEEDTDWLIELAKKMLKEK